MTKVGTCFGQDTQAQVNSKVSYMTKIIWSLISGTWHGQGAPAAQRYAANHKVLAVKKVEREKKKKKEEAEEIFEKFHRI